MWDELGGEELAVVTEGVVTCEEGRRRMLSPRCGPSLEADAIRMRVGTEREKGGV